MIRMRWSKEHKDLDRFRPLECNTLRPVWWFVFPLVLFDVLEGSLLPLYDLGEQGYMEILVEFCRTLVREVRLVPETVD